MKNYSSELIKLEKHLAERKRYLKGPFVSRNSGYEGELAKKLGFILKASRYCDSQFRSFEIEFKKGTSIWIDLVRFGEIVSELGLPYYGLTLFFIPDKRRTFVKEVVCVRTEALIKHLGLTATMAKKVKQLHNSVPRSLNAQASLTQKDVRKLAEFTI